MLKIPGGEPIVNMATDNWSGLDSRSVGPKGEVVLPKGWRDECGVDGDSHGIVSETEDGALKIEPL
jgi:hypothetical protein